VLLEGACLPRRQVEEQVCLRRFFGISRAMFRNCHGPISQGNTAGCKGSWKRAKEEGAPRGIGAQGGTVFFRSEDCSVGTCFGRPVPRTWNRVPPPFRVKYTIPSTPRGTVAWRMDLGHGTVPAAVLLGLCCVSISAQYRMAALGSQRSNSSGSR
jgi:hypothetical protein